MWLKVQPSAVNVVCTHNLNSINQQSLYLRTKIEFCAAAYLGNSEPSINQHHSSSPSTAEWLYFGKLCDEAAVRESFTKRNWDCDNIEIIKSCLIINGNIIDSKYAADFRRRRFYHRKLYRKSNGCLCLKQSKLMSDQLNGYSTMIRVAVQIIIIRIGANF